MLQMFWVRTGLCGVILLSLAGLAQAQVERLQPDFTFKRIGLPDGQGPRITVQIDPSAPRRAPIVAQPEPIAGVVLPPRTGFDWFWASVPASLDTSSPARLEIAINRINNPPAGVAMPAPRLQTLADIAARHGPDILRETVGTNVSPALVLAVIVIESAGRTDALSTAGAQGLMQLMPATANRFGVTDAFAPAQNISGGVAYLDWLLARFGNDPVLVLAAYNAGEGNVDRYAGVPPFGETRDYVPKVLAAWQVARGLCRTPPELLTDGCVFTTEGL
jgi:soluble lytic murein transglycosylase-like protein